MHILRKQACFTSLPDRILIVCWMFMNNVTNTFPLINVLSLHFPFKIRLRPVKWTPDKAIIQSKVFRYFRRKHNLLYFKLLQFTLLAQNNDLAASDNCLSDGFRVVHKFCKIINMQPLIITWQIFFTFKQLNLALNEHCNLIWIP